MDSKMLLTIHLISVNLFILIYLIKTILLFTNPARLDSFSKKIKGVEMLVSTVFLVSGIWLYALLGAIKSLQIMKLALVAISIPVAIAGFKNHRKLLAILAMLLIISAYGISEASRGKTYLPGRVVISSEVNTSNAEGVSGYLANCAMCHGANGDKEYRGSALLSSSRLDASAAATLIASGVKKGPRGTMPAFEGTLSESQINSIAAYIQGLKK